jgi:hypothetical protein
MKSIEPSSWTDVSDLEKPIRSQQSDANCDCSPNHHLPSPLARSSSSETPPASGASSSSLQAKIFYQATGDALKARPSLDLVSRPLDVELGKWAQDSSLLLPPFHVCSRWNKSTHAKMCLAITNQRTQDYKWAWPVGTVCTRFAIEFQKSGNIYNVFYSIFFSYIRSPLITYSFYLKLVLHFGFS